MVPISNTDCTKLEKKNRPVVDVISWGGGGQQCATRSAGARGRRQQRSQRRCDVGLRRVQQREQVAAASGAAGMWALRWETGGWIASCQPRRCQRRPHGRARSAWRRLACSVWVARR